VKIRANRDGAFKFAAPIRIKIESDAWEGIPALQSVLKLQDTRVPRGANLYGVLPGRRWSVRPEMNVTPLIDIFGAIICSCVVSMSQEKAWSADSEQSTVTSAHPRLTGRCDSDRLGAKDQDLY